MNEDRNIPPQNQQITAPDATPVVGAPQTDQVQPPAFEKKSWYKRPVAMAITGVLALAAIGGGVLALTNSSDDPITITEQTSVAVQQKPQNLASAIALIEGTVEHSTDGESWTAATGGETVNVGSYIRTAAASRVVLLLDDGSAVRLDENTQVSLMTSDANASEIMLVSGQVYTRVIASDSRTFAVITANERFEALGTAFKTSTAADQDSIEVYESEVMVESDDAIIKEGNQYDTKDKIAAEIDLERLKDDSFVIWNKDQDSSDNKFKDKLGVLAIDLKETDVQEPAPQPVADPAASLSLTGSTSDKGVALSWTNSGISANDGFKIVYDKTDSTPTYKENKAQYINSDKSSYTVSIKDGNTYNFRICAYRASAGTCDSYSNVVTVKAPLVEKEAVQSGAVTLTTATDQISWNFAGTAPHGFKVVLSSANNPTYPSNSIQYVGAGTTSASLPEKPAGTYYVRVCKYTADSNIDGGCTDYSNEVEYVVAE